MLRLVGGLALVGALVVGCGEQQATEPASRAEDRTAKLDQQQMISEDAGTLRAKAAPVSAVALPSCHELGAALGERATDLRLVSQAVNVKKLKAQKLDAAAADASVPTDVSGGSALAATPKPSSDPVRQRCEWRSRPAAEEQTGLVLTVERAEGQIRRTDVVGHVLDLPTVERAGGFVISPTQYLDLEAPLTSDGAQVVIGQLRVRIAAPGLMPANGTVRLDTADAITAALDVHRALAR
ncbi:hypothetical protein ACLM5J_15465 [Nocardioides sp. Bht2]|uniref:hypothetical protein n=1 Tax=Nocardioides sp. Bht2 TaxID=3392297 RepID=UPI0039B692A0